MATQKQLKEITKLIKKQNEETKSKSYDPKKQVEGYKTRIEGSGIDVDKALDKRSLVEKALNLPEDQNPLFDFFEILNRPQQAIFGAINASQKGESAGKGALKGIKGDEIVRFKDILQEEGIGQKDGKFGVDDVLGFAGDVILDPMNWAVLPASVASKAKHIKKAEMLFGSTDNTLRALNAASNAGEGFISGSAAHMANIAKAEKAHKLAFDALEQARTAGRYGQELKKYRQSVTGLALSGVGTGFKGAFKFTDNRMVDLLTAIDKYDVDTTKRLGMGVGRELKALSHYSNIKDMFRNTFDVAKNLPENLFAKSAEIRGKADFSKMIMLKQMEKYHQITDDVIKEVATKTGLTTAEVQRYLMTIYETGTDTFGIGDKIALSGLKRKTSFKSMVHDDAFLTNQGALKADADALEDFVKEYLPDWYKSNVTAESPLFREYVDKGNVVKNVYRIQNSEVKKSLDDALNALDKLDEDDIIKQMQKTKYSDDVAKEFTEAEKQASVYQSRLNNKKTKSFREGSDAYKLAAEKETELVKLAEDIEINKKHLDVARSWDIQTPDTKKAIKATKTVITKLQNKYDKGTLYINRLKELHYEDTQKLLDEALAKIDDIKIQFPDSPAVTKSDFMKLANKERVIGNYYSDEQLAKLEKFAQVEEVPELLTHLHLAMSNSIKALKTTMGLDEAFDTTSGYLAHKVTDEWQALDIDKLHKASKKTWLSTRELKGNTQAFASRRYKVSAMEANSISKSYAQYLVDTKVISGELADKVINESTVQMFAEDIKTSLLDFVNKSTKASGDASMLNYVLGKALLQTDGAGKNNYIRVRGEGEIIPRGYTQLTTESLEKKLDQMSVYIGGEFSQKYKEDALKFLTAHKGKELYINNNVNHLIGRLTDPVEQSSFVAAMDFVTNIFKKNKLLSPGFQMRNVVGNMSNMWLSGMSINDIMKYTKHSNQVIKNGDRLFELVSQGVKLSATEQSLYDEYAEFVQLGFKDLGSKIQDLPEHMYDRNARKGMWKAHQKEVEAAKKAGTTVPKATTMEKLSLPKDKYESLIGWNMAKNQKQDSIFRLAMLKYGKEHPEFLEKFDYLDAADAVRKTLFDFQDLSVTERDVLRKFVPFYTFTKKNLGFQLRNLQKNGVRYSNLLKLDRAFWNTLDLEDDELDKFKIENFWIPIPFKDSDGKYKAIKTSLPLGDLGEFLDDPLRRALSATAPIARAPFELAMNKQVFSDMPIQEFKGQKGFYIPELSKKAEFGISQLGLDVPVAQAMDIGRTLVQTAKGDITNPLDVAEGMIGRTLISQGDAERTATRTAYNELDELQNLMRYYKQEGTTIFTLAEIENRNKFSGNQAILSRLQTIRSIGK